MRDIDRIFTTYFEELDERLRPTVERLINVVVEMLPDVEHKRKWGRITFTRNGDRHHWICAIALDRKAVGLVVHKGALLAIRAACWKVMAGTCAPSPSPRLTTSMLMSSGRSCWRLSRDRPRCDRQRPRGPPTSALTPLPASRATAL